jgi:hypothetical protein
MWFRPPKCNKLHPREMLYCYVCVCVALLKVGFNLSAPVVRLTFYSSRSGSYTVTLGLIGGPRVVESLYSRSLPARSSK